MMLAFRPIYSFRERVTEWVLAIGLLIWGVSITWYPQVFTTAYYIPLLNVMSPQAWVGWTTSIGLFRLVALSINGAWRPTPHLRALGAIGGAMVWSSLFIISVLDPSERVTGIGTFGMLLAFELLSLWWAAGDAKMADILAAKRKQVEVNGG